MEKDKFSLKDLHFEFNLGETDYQIDVLQNELLMTYLRADPRFRRAFSKNYTNILLQFLKDKARLREPVHLSIMGVVRSGKSVVPETQILYSKNNHLKVMAIKELFEVYKQGNNLLIPSINLKTNKIELKKITNVIKHNYNDKIYKIFLNSGRIIEATKEHSFLILDKNTNKLIEKQGDELQEKDFIPIANKLPFRQQIKYIELMKYRKKRATNCFMNKIDKIKLDFNFGFLIGAFVSEGCLGINTSHISNNDKIFTEATKNSLKKIGLNYGLAFDKKRNHKDLLCYSIVLTDFFRETCYNHYSQDFYIGKGYGSSIKKLPDFFLFTPKEFKKGLLCGLFSGDGYLGFITSKVSLQYCSKSQELINQLALLLIDLGFAVKFRRKKINKGKYVGNIYYTIEIQNRNILKFINEIGFKTQKKIVIAKKIAKYYKKIESRLIEKINLDEFYFSKILKTKDIILDKINKIETYKYKGQVYDISVKDNHNFMLADGSFVHNSYIGISLATFLMACYGKKFNIDYICANAYEFIEKLKSMPQDKLDNTCFVIDESKQSVYGVGSIAKKMKISDVQNIIAIRGISTISLMPTGWGNKEAYYGLRLFGRCFKTKTCRAMLYNIQAGGKQAELPMGNVYLPIFTAFLPKEYAEELEKKYLEKKNEWVLQEQRGEGDVLFEIKKKTAESFCRDSKFLELTKKNEKLAYISYRLGSEWTKGEVEQIFELVKLMEKGMIDN